ncbi:hypothetical protein [Aliiruegeria sabulilitoris]|uniref:hypothetical protein n=1 Tax=Aliiruegeria sabulilitoris TaxID=1510458 RepID=UPI00082F6065|nr:hypothetical protein [Aliiruegeria sabulilitoris]
MTVKTVGLDLAKDVFQVHCVSATGRKIINKKIKRAKLLVFLAGAASPSSPEAAIRRRGSDWK